MRHPASEYLADTRPPLIALSIRISIYYLVLGLLVTALFNFAPSVAQHFPVGGLEEVAANDPALRELNNALMSGDQSRAAQITDNDQVLGSRLDGAIKLLIAMICTITLMLPVSWLYQCIHINGEQDHSLDETALILPTVVAGIVTVVQHSLALAFSLAGIVAGVRFRRALSDTFDTLFIFVAIGVGIAAGVGSIEIAAVMTMFFNFATLGICLFGDGLETQHAAVKKMERRVRKQEEAAAREKEKAAEADQPINVQPPESS
ncbi:MAG: DUF4956 domain-containing protein [Lysobacterales bacterium]